MKTIRHVSAIAPLLMSLAALAIVLGYLALSGPVRQADEGAAAHLFQLLIVGQLPFVAHFAFHWMPKAPARGLGVLGLQVLAVGVAVLPVALFQL
ncbi:hypothetical protein [Dyella lutea]|uniref:Uncharacterized protein n=1 Tax=Dyella lutea TaxID=2950441 RepID=A0ABT1FE83_9GAMM|nr:hypothetical protein [Dyella lutea]MCP1375696.1 hypothetical protein [Dyella lutea]